MAEIESILDPVLEKAANGLLARDFAMPEPQHRWARLHLAMSHSYRVDTKNSQYALERDLEIPRQLLIKAREPSVAVPRKGSLKGKLPELAKRLDVDLEWLSFGYRSDGTDAWPAWTAELTARWRSVILQIGRTYLLKIIDLEREGTLSKQQKMSCVPRVVTEHAGLSGIGPMVPGIVPSPKGGFPRELSIIHDYLIRRDLDFDDYFQRFSGLIGSDFTQLRQIAQQDPVTRRKSQGRLPAAFAMGLRQKPRLGTTTLLKDEIAAHLEDQERIVAWFASRIGTCPRYDTRPA